MGCVLSETFLYCCLGLNENIPTLMVWEAGKVLDSKIQASFTFKVVSLNYLF